MSVQDTTTIASDSAVPRWRRRFKYAAMILLIGVLVAEMAARSILGLGDPPITVTHPTIEYLFAPDQDIRRFGNRFQTNSYSMRSPEFAKVRQEPRELRVLVLGDSIINGGVLTDQSKLATELLRPDLEERLGRPVVVANISAGSWGPPNLLAYVKEFGTFDADIAVLVLSSHDAADVPTFAPLDENAFPQKKPPFALWEAATRYLPRYLPGARPSDQAPPSDSAPKNDEEALSALTSLIDLLQDKDIHVAVLLHETRSELESGADPGQKAIKQVCSQAGIKPINLGPAFKQSIDRGEDPYRDDGLHPNDIGQRLIYEELRQAVAAELAPER
jgi:hypothetical protein